MSADRRSGRGLLSLQVAGAALLAVAFTALLWLFLGDKGQLALKPGDLGQGDYRLQATTGQPFTAASLKGAPSLVFFGFTHCPDVCPTTLGDIALWQDELGEVAKPLRVFFVTVDPERDPAEVLAEYVGWLPGAVGVTGPQEEVDRALRSFRVFARKVPLEGGDYIMDHSASVLMFGADGQLVDTIPYQSPLSDALAKLRALLAA